MRKILLLLMVCVSLGVNAQSNEYDYYCQVYRDGAYGRITTPQIGKLEYVIYNKNGETEGFVNDPQLLTYMSKRGWQLVNTTEVRIRGSVNDGLTSVYLLKKQVSSDKEAMDGLKIGTLNSSKDKKEKKPDALDEFLKEKGISEGTL